MDSKKMNDNSIAIVGAPEIEPHPDSPSLGNSVVFSLDTDSDTFEDVNSSYSSPAFADIPPAYNDPVLDMSDLFLQLPIKSGLSKYYQGKSRSFTSLANVRSLQDLAKPEHPYNKKIKLMASRGEDDAEASLGDTNGRGISMSSRVSCPSFNAEMSNPNPGITSRPPVSPRTSTTTSISKKTPLYA